MKIIRKIGIGLVCLILILAAGCGYYLAHYYHSSAEAKTVASNDQVTVLQKDDCLWLIPDQPRAGLIFYPGGKVEYDAYAPLMEQLADQGILCVIPHLTGNIAFLEMNAADDIIADEMILDDREIDHWYIGGHSLGGVSAAIYAGKHANDLEGLILLASYSTADLRDSNLKVLSIYGSNDQVLSLNQYEEAKAMLPDDAEELVIEGGCHAYFGDYGEQEGDGAAGISRKEQQAITCETIVKWMNK